MSRGSEVQVTVRQPAHSRADGLMSRGVVRMADQFHFDPGTYLEMVRAEVPDYEQLQEVVAEAASEIRADTILDLGTGTGETLRRVARRHPTARESK